METALNSSVGIAAYLAVFAAVGLVFVFVNLLLGRFLRPHNPNAEKLEIYECGEPAIGSSFVQFDLRFYVVALVFIIFDVEVAFLFPWATVFGKVTNLWQDRASLVEVADADSGALALTQTAELTYRELGIANPVVPPTSSVAEANDLLRNGASEAGELTLAGLQHLTWFATAAVAFFFVVLLIGFAYEWRTGALDWVRAITPARSTQVNQRLKTPAGSQESVLTA